MLVWHNGDGVVDVFKYLGCGPDSDKERRKNYI